MRFRSAQDHTALELKQERDFLHEEALCEEIAGADVGLKHLVANPRCSRKLCAKRIYTWSWTKLGGSDMAWTARMIPGYGKNLREAIAEPLPVPLPTEASAAAAAAGAPKKGRRSRPEPRLSHSRLRPPPSTATMRLL